MSTAKTGGGDGRKTVNPIKNNLYMLKMAWRLVPGRVALNFLSTVIQYFGWAFFSVFFLRFVISAMEAQKPFFDIVLFVTVTSAVFLALDFFSAWFRHRYVPLSDQIIYEKLNVMLFDKAANLSLSCYENPAFYNTYTLAMENAAERMRTAFEKTNTVLVAAVAMSYVFYTMFLIDRYVALFVIFPVIGNFVFARINNRLTYERDRKNTPHVRRRDYVNRAVYLGENAKEFRLSNILRVLLRSYDEAYQGMVGVLREYGGRLTFMYFLRNMFTFVIIFEGVLFYGAYRAIVGGSIGVDEFAILSGAMTSATWMLIGLTNSLMELSKNGLYVRNIRDFLQYKSDISEDQEGVTPDNQIRSIEFRGVTFRYQGADTDTLRDVSFTIREGEKIALAGHNGAGKTTLVKLLLRFYDPSEGVVLVNGIDIRRYNLRAYRALFAAAFQDFRIFAMSVSENVLLTDVEETDAQTVRSALEKSGALERIDALPKRDQSVLTREFDTDGAVLSGGEYQKIAVARAFARPHSIAVYDEPSSALDPIAEHALFESILKAGEGHIVFYISHRLSSAKRADRVLLFENGCMTEAGTHDELMATEGTYAQMFRMQAEKYVQTEYAMIEKANGGDGVHG